MRIQQEYGVRASPFQSWRAHRAPYSSELLHGRRKPGQHAACDNCRRFMCPLQRDHPGVEKQLHPEVGFSSYKETLLTLQNIFVRDASAARHLLTRRVDPLVMKSLNAIEVLELVRTHGPSIQSAYTHRRLANRQSQIRWTHSRISRALVLWDLGLPAAAGVKTHSAQIQDAPRLWTDLLRRRHCAEWIRFESFDLQGRTLHRNVLPTRPERGARGSTLKQGIGELLSAAPNDCASSAAPGSAGDHRCAPRDRARNDNVFGWRDLHLGDKMSTHFGLPVQIDNDVNVAALAELRAGSAPQDFVLLRLYTVLERL